MKDKALRKSSDSLVNRVDEVLYYQWDPIGVSDEPFARGEYRSYVGKVVQLVAEGKTAFDISAHLKAIIQSQMGLTPDNRRCDAVAAILLEHKIALDEGSA